MCQVTANPCECRVLSFLSNGDTRCAAAEKDIRNHIHSNISIVVATVVLCIPHLRRKKLKPAARKQLLRSRHSTARYGIGYKQVCNFTAAGKLQKS